MFWPYLTWVDTKQPLYIPYGILFEKKLEHLQHATTGENSVVGRKEKSDPATK